MRGRSLISAAWLFAASLLGACTANAPPETAETEPVSNTATSAIAAGAHSVPLDLSAFDDAALARARTAFALSCPQLLAREDASGLARPGDWQAACVAANAPAGDARSFFTTHFSAVRVGDGAAFSTGYFEPQILGSRTRAPGYETPIYAVPDDLVTVRLGDFSDELSGKTVRGRVEDGVLVLYHDRAEIVDGALAGRGLEIAWAADPVDLFFLQIQGSGRLLLPDGDVMRIGYAGQNGRSYVAVGRVLRERGVFAPGEATMQKIVDYIRADPARGHAVMNANPSYVFFRELTGPGPIGALGVAVTPRATVAADPAFVPLGAPVLLSGFADPVDGIWVAQDTGGAIKGANRFDTFWGAGEEAKRIAGALQANGGAVILLPKAAAARLDAR